MIWNRTVAVLIDSVILAVISIPFMDFGTHTRIENGRQMEIQSFGLNGPEFLIWLVFGFAYFIILEWLFAATPGKFAVGIRVVRQDGQPAPLVSVAVRNLMRIADGFPYVIPYLIGFLSMGGSQGRQRLGDKAAGTMVVPRDETVALQQ